MVGFMGTYVIFLEIGELPSFVSLFSSNKISSLHTKKILLILFNRQMKENRDKERERDTTYQIKGER